MFESNDINTPLSQSVLGSTHVQMLPSLANLLVDQRTKCMRSNRWKVLVFFVRLLVLKARAWLLSPTYPHLRYVMFCTECLESFVHMCMCVRAPERANAAGEVLHMNVLARRAIQLLKDLNMTEHGSAMEVEAFRLVQTIEMVMVAKRCGDHAMVSLGNSHVFIF